MILCKKVLTVLKKGVIIKIIQLFSYVVTHYDIELVILKLVIDKNVTLNFQWDNLWNDLVEVCSMPHKVTVLIN